MLVGEFAPEACRVSIVFTHECLLALRHCCVL
jgi:hypothetical protein